MLLKLITKLLKVLGSDTDPRQISLGFCFSMFCGLTPLLGPHNLAVIFCVFVLRVNVSAFLAGLLCFSGVGYLFDPLTNRLGWLLLSSNALEGFWTMLYNTTFFRMMHFNNTAVMGGAALALICTAPVYILSNTIIRRYRVHVLQWVRKSRLMSILKASKIAKFFMKFV